VTALNVLVVDDEFPMQRALRRMLQRLGHQCSLAGDVPEAIEQIGTQMPGLILVDLNLGETDAYAILRHLESVGSAVPVIGMSAAGDVDDLIRFMRLGAVDFLKKPISLDDLDHAIARFQKRTELREVAAGGGAEEPEPAEVGLTGYEGQSLVERISITLDSLRSGKIELPVVGSLASSVFAVFEEADCGVNEVVKLASSDPGFTTAVMRSANSGALAAGRPATSLREACVHLGNQRVAAVAQTVLAGRLHELGEGPLGKMAAALWINCQVTALAVRAYASQRRGMDSEEAHLAALLHNIGELLVLQALQALIEDGGPRVDDPATVERICASIHEQVGPKFLDSWSAPPSVSALAGCHHAAPGRLEGPSARHLRLVVHDCWVGAIVAGYGYYPSHRGASFDQLAPELSSHRRTQIRQVVAMGVKAFIEQQERAAAMTDEEPPE